MLNKSLIIAFFVLFKESHSQTLPETGIAEDCSNKLPNCPQISKWEDLEPTLTILTDLSKENGGPEIKTIASLSNLMKMLLGKVQIPIKEESALEEEGKEEPNNAGVLSETITEEDVIALNEILDDIETVLGIPTGTDKSVRQVSRDEELIWSALQNQREIINALNAKTVEPKKSANDIPPDLIPIFKPNNFGGCLERINRVDGKKGIQNKACPCQGAKVVAANLNIPSSKPNPCNTAQTIPAKTNSNVQPISGNNPLLNNQVCVCNTQERTNYNMVPPVNSVGVARQSALIGNGNTKACSNQCQLCQSNITPKQNLITSLNISPLTSCRCTPGQGCQCYASVGIGNIPNTLAKSVAPCQSSALLGPGYTYTPLLAQNLAAGKIRDQSINNQCQKCTNPTSNMMVKPKLGLKDVYGSLLQKLTTNVLVPYYTTKSAMYLKRNS